MQAAMEHAVTSQTQDGSPGSYALRQLINNVPLSTDENGIQAHITCVDAWKDNLYIGTSAGQVFHYVSIPPDPADDTGLPSYIFATQIEPYFKSPQEGADAGVKQILLLPSQGKACIVCNNTYTFYTLPELSPAYEGTIQQSGCLWVGGLDRNEVAEEEVRSGGPVVVICLRQRMRFVNNLDGPKPRMVRNIELGEVRSLQRRGDLACVADNHTYSLLDVVNQRKNELFPISSLDEGRPVMPELPDPPTMQNRQPSRSFSSRSPIRQDHGHQRNTSLGGQPQQNDRLRPDSGSRWPARSSSHQAEESPASSSSREDSPAKQEPALERQHSSESQPAKPAAQARPLQAHILSPTPTEFLLTTGTRLAEPGVGLFVNLEGDVVRGTMEFSSYPESLVLDASGLVSSLPTTDEAPQEGYVLAVVRRKLETSLERCIEIQRWDTSLGEAQNTKEWLFLDEVDAEASSDDPLFGTGLRNATASAQLAVNGVSSALRLRRLHLKANFDEDADRKRDNEEDKLAERFAQVQASVLLFQKASVHWVVPTPLVTQLDMQLIDAVQQTNGSSLTIDVSVVQRVFNSIRGQDPKDELEFLTLTYIRQKSALLLFGNLILQTVHGIISYEHDKRRAEDALISGEVDPRIVLALVPPFDREIAEGSTGIWVPQGLRDTMYTLRDGIDTANIDRNLKGPYGDNLLILVKRYLSAWRKKKGFGSVANEAQVFQTVDAALLHILLILDEESPRGAAVQGSVRMELNDVVDHRVDCFERAIELFEQYNRLYMLSRLYQSRNMVAQVLATWKRILEGEPDAGGELVEGEMAVRKYLSKIRDSTLVKNYGAWLAHRNPKLGVQVFADDSSKVQFEPADAVAVLKERAPEAVKDYLEHLVFGKNHVQYVNDLIAFYLDTVLTELEKSDEAKNILTQSYHTYRALHPPKPTYREFITDNAIDAEWWHSRLRLLQLIGGSHGAASEYDVQSLGQRLAPYSNELVPEMIILNGREQKHEEALRLLTHGLGDYDTAIRYCLLGGSSIFHPASSHGPEQALPSKAEQSKLFGYLLNEFFKLEDLSDRLERTAELLERFGGWFDIAEVLAMIPDEWSVELVSGFLMHALRRLVRERNETMIVKALSTAQNLKTSADFAEKLESAKPTVVKAEVDAG